MYSFISTYVIFFLIYDKSVVFLISVTYLSSPRTHSKTMLSLRCEDSDRHLRGTWAPHFCSPAVSPTFNLSEATLAKGSEKTQDGYLQAPKCCTGKSGTIFFAF